MFKVSESWKFKLVYIISGVEIEWQMKSWKEENQEKFLKNFKLKAKLKALDFN